MATTGVGGTDREKNAMSTPTEHKWQRSVWIGVACALAVALLLLIGLVASTLWRAASVFSTHSREELAFAFAGFNLVTQTMIRLVAIFVGACMAFGGLAVSFYVHAHSSDIRGDGMGVKAALTTNSPGITAIVVGAAVVIFSVFKVSVLDFKAPTTTTTTTTTTQQQPSSSGASDSRNIR